MSQNIHQAVPETATRAPIKIMAHTGYYDAILFDLDGTLTNSRTGNIRCFEYALAKMGCRMPSEEILTTCIGPPLRTSFAKLLDTTDAAVIETGLAHFRDRYATVGLLESESYSGTVDLLAKLRQMGHRLFVVTSTPAYFAKQILQHFLLALYFDEIYGPKMDGTRDDKSDLLKFAIKEQGLDRSSILMVGDRCYDMKAAQNNGIDGLGVTYGFGSAAELLASGAVGVCSSGAAVTDWIIGTEVRTHATVRQKA